MYSKNPFEDDDDEYTFASQARKNKAITSNGGGSRCNTSTNPFMDEDQDTGFGPKKVPYDVPQPANVDSRQMLLQNTMNRQLESTTRCLAQIYETEAIGIATAEELVQQGEKLDNIERNADKITADTKVTQKHLNSIKSVFGSLKNWWSGEPKKSDAPAQRNARDRSNTTLSKAISTKSYGREDHPAVKAKGFDVKGFYDADVVEYKDYDPDSFTRSSSAGQVSSWSTSAKSPQQREVSSSTSRSKMWDDYEHKFENNLNLMSNGLENLKMLAGGLRDEIDVQNEQLDRITGKVENSDAKIRNQNLQMKHILGK